MTKAYAEAHSFLISSLDRRYRPEDTLRPIMALLDGQLSEEGEAILCRYLPTYASWMPTDFTRAKPLDHRIDTLSVLDGELVKAPNRSRLANRVRRLERALVREQIDAERQNRLYRAAQFAETIFAPEIPRIWLSDARTLAFVAYMTARNAVRSRFTNKKQDNPFDPVASGLLRMCVDSATTHWPAVAMVRQTRDILARLTDDEAVSLLERSGTMLQEIATLLEGVAARSKISVRTMIVHQGNDSSTWNALAGAWNRARDVWIACLERLGLLETLDQFCPGKVLRLMAGDVAVWHRFTDGDAANAQDDSALHPDTKVWRDLPFPWRVLAGEAECPKAMVLEVCARHGVDPIRSGWTGTKARTKIDKTKATPELVHGITVNHPTLAYLLRKVGVFSGKSIKGSVVWIESPIV